MEIAPNFTKIINKDILPASHPDGHISQNFHAILDLSEPDKPLIYTPQNNCGPLKILQ
jgi:hypothetical protein